MRLTFLSALGLLSSALGAQISTPGYHLDLAPRSDGRENHIVVLNDGATVQSLLRALTLPLDIGHRFQHVLNGFTAPLNKLEITALEALPIVKYIEKDEIVSIKKIQTNSTYGLAMTSAKNKLPPKDQNLYRYRIGKQAATAYVIDTGIDVTHPEFEGRASIGVDMTGEGAFDGNGHGTHVSGTIGSKSYGIFKEARLVGVKALNSAGSGSSTSIIASIDWVQGNRKGPSVINMSLGTAFDKIRATNDAVRSARNSGITVVVSAGNLGDQGFTACDASPSSSPAAITVGAVSTSYKVADFSGQDECVDMHGPGVNVLSTWPGNRTEVLSGTSMATPHVAGVAAYFMSVFNVTDPFEVRNLMVKYAKVDLLDNTRGAPNLLVNNAFFTN